LIARAIEAGVRVEVVPGPSAAVTALVGSGLPTEAFYFGGFPPRQAGARREAFARMRGLQATLVFYEAPGRVAATLADLAAALGGRSTGWRSRWPADQAATGRPADGRPWYLRGRGMEISPRAQLGKYELIELLGSGGMAEVWRARVRGAAGFQKEVALKLMRG